MMETTREALATVARYSPALDSIDAWPSESLAALAAAGCLGDAIPPEFSGAGRAARDVLDWQLELASVCLLTAFVQSQRDAACHRIAMSPNANLKARVFREALAGRLFVTVGISHLSTSRQHLRQPAVGVTETADGFRLTGAIPWVSGARHADEIVVGGTLPDGRQILGLVPREGAGLSVGPSTPLMALSASQTASIKLENVEIPRERLLVGPIEQVMKRSGHGTGSLTTSTLALGHALGSLRRLRSEAERRPDLGAMVNAFEEEAEELRTALRNAAGGGDGASPEKLREAANSLVLRITQAELAVSKGAGYAAGHPAERAVREAMFFLVWSCPQPVVQTALREFARLPTEG